MAKDLLPLAGLPHDEPVLFRDVSDRPRLLEPRNHIEDAIGGIAGSGVGRAFSAVVRDRRKCDWLPEGQAESEVDALLEALRQAAVIHEWDADLPSVRETSEYVDYSLCDALRLASADGKLMARVGGNLDNLARGMLVYVSRAQLSRGMTPW
jgi:hypothetical protein